MMPVLDPVTEMRIKLNRNNTIQPSSENVIYAMHQQEFAESFEPA